MWPTASPPPGPRRRVAPWWAALAVAAVAAAAFHLAQAAAPGVASADAALSVAREHHRSMLALQAAHPWAFVCGFCLVFGAISALAVPGASVLALCAGAWFGPAWGTLLVTCASAAGATATFLAARRWGQAAVRRRWPRQAADMDERVARRGAWMLFSLRLAPVVPYPLLNPLMGLTGMHPWTFFWVSALGMAAGSALYAVVGERLAAATLVSSAPAGTALAEGAAWLAVLAVLPWAIGWAWQALRGRQSA